MGRTLILRSAALVLGWVASGLVLTQQAPPQPLTIEKLADDLHVIIGSRGGNVAVLSTSEGVILVDDKFEQNVPNLAKANWFPTSRCDIS